MKAQSLRGVRRPEEKAKPQVYKVLALIAVLFLFVGVMLFISMKFA